MGGSSMIGGSMGYGSMMPLMSYSPMMSPMGYSGMNSMGYSMMNQGYSMMNPMGSMQYGSMPGYATGLSMGYGPPLAYSSAYGVYPGASYSSILPFGYRSLGYRRRPYLLSPYSYYSTCSICLSHSHTMTPFDASGKQAF